MSPTPRFAFGPRNYRLMWVGLAVLAAGFVTMMLDKADYGEGFLGLTLGPILLFVGFCIEFAAIMVRSNPGELVTAAFEPVVATAPVAAPVVPVAAAPVAPTPPARPSRPTSGRANTVLLW